MRLDEVFQALDSKIADARVTTRYIKITNPVIWIDKFWNTHPEDVCVIGSKAIIRVMSVMSSDPEK